MDMRAEIKKNTDTQQQPSLPTPEIVQWQTIMFFMNTWLLVVRFLVLCATEKYLLYTNGKITLFSRSFLLFLSFTAYTHNVKHFNYIFIIS